MNIIHVPIFGITIMEATAAGTVVSFIEELITRNPFICDRIYSYMAQEYLPNNPQSKNHILAKRRDAFSNNGYYSLAGGKQGDALVQLKNGWYLYRQLNSTGFANQLLARIEEVLSSTGVLVKVYAYLNATKRPPGVRHYTQDDIEKFVTVEPDPVVVEPEFDDDLGERERRLLNFWTGLVEHSRSQQIGPQLSQKPSKNHWYDVSIGAGGYHISLHFLTQKKVVRCGIWFRHNGTDCFDELVQDREHIEAITGPLEWNSNNTADKRPTISVETMHTDDLTSYNWFMDNISNFTQAFGK